MTCGEQDKLARELKNKKKNSISAKTSTQSRWDKKREEK